MLDRAADHIVTTLRGGAVRAVTDPADLNPPAVWVTPAAVRWNRLDNATGEVDLDLYLTVSGAKPLAALDKLAAAVRAAGVQVRDAEAVTVTLPNHNPAGLPALRTTITVEVK